MTNDPDQTKQVSPNNTQQGTVSVPSPLMLTKTVVTSTAEESETVLTLLDLGSSVKITDAVDSSQNSHAALEGLISISPEIIAEKIAEQEELERIAITYPGVNRQYWYGEEDIELIIKNMLDKDLQGPRHNIIVKGDQSSTIGCDLIIGGSSSHSHPKLDLLEKAFIEVLNSDMFKTTTHTFMLPLHIKQEHHWVLGLLTVKFVTIGEHKKFSHKARFITVNSFPPIKNKLHTITQLFFDSIKDHLLKYIDESELLAEIDSFYVMRQPDLYSCGAIVVEQMLSLISEGKIIPSDKSYCIDAIMQMRTNHISIAGEAFARKQLANKEYTCSEKSYALETEDLDAFCQKFFALVQGDEEFFKMAREFVDVESQLERLNHDEYFTAEINLDKLIKRGIESTAAIKFWFSDNYIRLGDIVLTFFKERKDATEELTWRSTKDTLILVIRSLLMLNAKANQKAKKRDHHSTEHEELIYVEADIGPMYGYKGTVNANKQAHGTGYERFGTTVEYIGSFKRGRRADRGVEEICHVSNVLLTFSGTRKEDGTFIEGSIKCIIGPELHNMIDAAGNEMYVYYQGQVFAGKPWGIGVLSISSQDEPQMVVRIDEAGCAFVAFLTKEINLADMAFKHFKEHMLDMRFMPFDQPITTMLDQFRERTISNYCTLKQLERSTNQAEPKAAPPMLSQKANFDRDGEDGWRFISIDDERFDTEHQETNGACARQEFLKKLR